MLTGTCHCGAAGWTFEGDAGTATACNCTLCHRYGTIWAYDYENERILLDGPMASYVRADEPDPALETLFCARCGNVIAWRALRIDEQGRRRVGVNLRLATPQAVAEIPVKHLDGRDTWELVARPARWVGDMWF